MTGRTVTALAAVSAAAVAAGIVGAIAIAGGTGGSSSASAFDRVSNPGTPVAAASVPDRVKGVLASGGAQQSLSRLGARNGVVFYTAPGATKGVCYAKGPVSTGGIAILGCPSGTNPGPVGRFPSAEAPILDMSGLAVDLESRTTTFLDLAGFAADGITKVALIDTFGVVHSAPVADNVYARDVPEVAAKALLAFDSAGNEVFRRGYGE